MRVTLAFAFFFTSTALAAPSPQSASPTSTAPESQSTICGDIVNSESFVFLASDAYACLTSVPFNTAVATRFLSYYNDTLQFHTTPAYLKVPPPSYQQPSIDLVRELEQLQQEIDNGVFQNQYAFEAKLQNLIYATHDSHLELVAGVLAAFTFASPYRIVSVSSDGKELPKVYITNDLIESQGNDSSWQASAISLINGQDAAEYLAQFAAFNAIGGLEPHADWNQLMSSPVLDIQNYYSIFEGYSTFYPGEDITTTFENGTVIGPDPWLAIYNNPGETWPLSTGGDFYNFFVLGYYPASYNPEIETESDSAESSSAPSATTLTSDPSLLSTTATPTPTGWDHPAYPQTADVVQQDLGISGVVTGYFLSDVSIGVLSIPSFQAYDSSVEDFSTTITNFLQRSKEAGIKKILIDLQQNLGGNTLLAIDTFKQFFPDTEPFAGSRLRAHATADILGNTFTQYYDTEPLEASVYAAYTVSDWVATSLLNAEAANRNFSSWGEFYGPHLYNADQFTTTQRYNLSSDIFDQAASGGITIYGYASRPATAPQPYAPDDIIILTDASCSSACALFMEAMQHDAGVKSVVVGGQPANGPMQAPSGTRGAEFYSINDLDADFEVAKDINVTAGVLLPSRLEDIYISYMGINIKDQIRDSEDTPLQFLYLAADCRIFFTPQTFWNMTNLWKYAAAALTTNPEYCVTDSTGYRTPGPNNTSTSPSTVSPNINSNITYITDIIVKSDTVADLPDAFSGQHSGVVRSTYAKAGQPCKSDAGCPGGGFKCMSVPSCGSVAQRCVRTCSSYDNNCGGFRCNLIKTEAPATVRGVRKEIRSGYCPISSADCRASVTGPQRFSPTTVPSPKQASSNRGKGGGGKRDEWLAGGDMGGIVEAGLEVWR